MQGNLCGAHLSARPPEEWKGRKLSFSHPLAGPCISRTSHDMELCRALAIVMAVPSRFNSFMSTGLAPASPFHASDNLRSVHQSCCIYSRTPRRGVHALMGDQCLQDIAYHTKSVLTMTTTNHTMLAQQSLRGKSCKCASHSVLPALIRRCCAAAEHMEARGLHKAAMCCAALTWPCPSPLQQPPEPSWRARQHTWHSSAPGAGCSTPCSPAQSHLIITSMLLPVFSLTPCHLCPALQPCGDS